jgi:flavoprotein
MPVLGIGSKFVTNAIALTGTSDTDVYTVPSNFSSHVEHLMITNSDSSNRNYTLKYYQAATTTTHTLFNSHAVAGKGSESVFTVDRPLYIHAGDKLILSAATANTLTVVVAAEEFYDPNR